MTFRYSIGMLVSGCTCVGMCEHTYTRESLRVCVTRSKNVIRLWRSTFYVISKTFIRTLHSSACSNDAFYKIIFRPLLLEWKQICLSHLFSGPFCPTFSSEIYVPGREQTFLTKLQMAYKKNSCVLWNKFQLDRLSQFRVTAVCVLHVGLTRRRTPVWRLF